MNILIISRNYLPSSGGIEYFLSNLVKDLAYENNKIFIFARGNPGQDNYEAKENVEIKRSGNFRDLRKLIGDFTQFIKNKKISVILFCEPRVEETLLTLISKIKYQCKTILFLVGTMSQYARKRDKIFAGLVANSIIGISEFAREKYGFFKRKSKVIYLGIRFKSSDNLPVITKRENIILSVGRIDPRKCYETLIEAIPLINEQIDNIRFVIIGNTSVHKDYYEKLKKMIENYDIKNLEFTGQVIDDKLMEYYLKSKLFVLTSIHEMFGLVLIESMYYGLPIIANNVTAIPEIVTEKEGILIEPKNPEILAEKIIYLMNNDVILKGMSQNAKERAKLFEWKKTYGEYKKIIFN